MSVCVFEMVDFRNASFRNVAFTPTELAGQVASWMVNLCVDTAFSVQRGKSRSRRLTAKQYTIFTSSTISVPPFQFVFIFSDHFPKLYNRNTCNIQLYVHFSNFSFDVSPAIHTVESGKRTGGNNLICDGEALMCWQWQCKVQTHIKHHL